MTFTVYWHGLFENKSFISEHWKNNSYFFVEEAILNEDRTTEDERRFDISIDFMRISGLFFRYILEARKRALAKKKKLRTLGKRARSADSEDEVEEDGM